MEDTKFFEQKRKEREVENAFRDELGLYQGLQYDITTQWKGPYYDWNGQRTNYVDFYKKERHQRAEKIRAKREAKAKDPKFIEQIRARKEAAAIKRANKKAKLLLKKEKKERRRALRAKRAEEPKEQNVDSDVTLIGNEQETEKLRESMVAAEEKRKAQVRKMEKGKADMKSRIDSIRSNYEHEADA
jgi:hypothetical protein